MSQIEATWPAVTRLPVTAEASAPQPVSGGQSEDPVLAAVINAVRIASVPLDLSSYATIMGSIEGAAGNDPQKDDAALRNAISMIGDTLSHGEGGYFIAINAPAAV